MADGCTFEIPGLEPWLAELRKLPQAMQTRLVRGAVATGVSVIRVAAIGKAPLFTGDVSQGHPPPGTLKRSIYQTRLADKCTPTLEVWKVDVRAGKRTTKKGGTQLGAYYARWVEYGHYTRAPASAGKTRAQRRKALQGGTVLVEGAQYILPRPFMRPAFEQSKAAALKAAQAYINENLPLAVASFRYIQAKN
jgi:hypothetical protein